MNDPKPTPKARFCRRAGGSWIETRKSTTPLGTVEEITLSTTPPPKAPEPSQP